MSDYASSPFIMSAVSLILSIIMSVLAIFAMIRVGKFDKKINFAIFEYRTKIGKLIRELNIIHQSRRNIDNIQNDQISDLMDEI